MSLALLLTITFLNVVLGASFSDYLLASEAARTVGIDEITGALAIIIALVGIAIAAGISVLGSGIAGESVRTIVVIVGYGSIWGFFSALSMNLIIEIEIFGWIIYLALTIAYAVGVMSKVSN